MALLSYMRSEDGELSMKTSEAFTELMNQLEIIHAENLIIYEVLLIMSGVDDTTRENVLELWDKRFQDERKKYG